MSWIGIVFFKEKTSKIASSNCSLLSSENEKKKPVKKLYYRSKKSGCYVQFFQDADSLFNLGFPFWSETEKTNSYLTDLRTEPINISYYIFDARFL